MTVTITLVHVGANRLRYLYTGTGVAPAITTTGGASPDLLTDSIAGPIKKLAKAFTDGYGKLAAGAFTQAQSRALWLSDDPTNAVALVGNQVPTAKIRNTLRGTPDHDSVWDANVDGSGHPTLTLSGETSVGAVTGYLDIEVDDAIGD
jgi:hypothetical protein